MEREGRKEVSACISAIYGGIKQTFWGKKMKKKANVPESLRLNFTRVVLICSDHMFNCL